MRRPQFSLKTLLWLMLLVAALLGGRAIGIQDERKRLAAEVAAEKERLRRQMDDLSARIRDVQSLKEDLELHRERLIAAPSKQK